MPETIRESDIVRQVTDWLKLRRAFYWRCNTGAMQKGKHFVRFGIQGVPDILCCHRGQMVGIECKRPRAYQSRAQKCFQTALEAAGGKYILCYRLEDVIEGMR